MRLKPSLSWSLDAGHARIDPQLFDLLAKIRTYGSLRAACDAIGMPYRTAWGLLRDMEGAFGLPLVELQRGRGAALTSDGANLLHADESARQKLARELAGMVLDIGAPSARTRDAPAPILRVAASHDLALAALQDALPAAAGVALEIEFCGSREALQRFKKGRADMAGFHLVPGDVTASRAFLRYLGPARDRLVRFVDREQGLIMARGRKHLVRRLAEVVERDLRFVNRQAGSGTRMLIDAQLARESIDASAVRGYETEEFTHAAVAATIASGQADVGFGVAAAAAEYDLAFVPVARERYYLAVRRELLHSAPIKSLRDSLAGPVFRNLVGHMVGYDASHSGDVENLPAARARRRP